MFVTSRAVLLNAAAPGAVATMIELANAILPKAADEEGVESRLARVTASVTSRGVLLGLRDR